MEVIGDRVVVNLAQRSFLCTDGTGEISEMVNRKRDVSSQRFTHGLAIVPGFGDCQHFQIGFHAVGDFVEHVGAFGHRCFAPGRESGMGGIKRLFDIVGAGTGDLAERFAIHRRHIFKILALGRGDPFAANEVLITALEADRTAGVIWILVDHFGSSEIDRRFFRPLFDCDAALSAKVVPL